MHAQVHVNYADLLDSDPEFLNNGSAPLCVLERDLKKPAWQKSRGSS
jgi:hypothetical protein